MVESCRDEANRVMADTTVLIGRNMIELFRGGKSSRMTRDAVIHDPDMVKGRRYKAGGFMALAAIADGWHMAVGFSCGGNPIVTGCTVIQNALVIKLCTSKGHGVMAHRAILRRGVYRNMVC